MERERAAAFGDVREREGARGGVAQLQRAVDRDDAGVRGGGGHGGSGRGRRVELDREGRDAVGLDGDERVGHEQRRASDRDAHCARDNDALEVAAEGREREEALAAAEAAGVLERDDGLLLLDERLEVDAQ
eukprot:627649-Rhodomonas_salina.2